ncbi:MAG: Flp family type IVb pilin [Tepidiformaceae bacterium]
MSKLKNWTLKKYVALQHGEEEGQGLAEYGLILALIAVVCIAGLTLMGGKINTLLSGITFGAA